MLTNRPPKRPKLLRPRPTQPVSVFEVCRLFQRRLKRSSHPQLSSLDLFSRIYKHSNGIYLPSLHRKHSRRFFQPLSENLD
jgi:hypothetical protein